MILALSISGFIFGVGAFILGGWALIEVLAQKRSTHSIQYVPATDFMPKPVPKVSNGKTIEEEQGAIDKAIKENSKKFNEYIPLNDAEDFLDV